MLVGLGFSVGNALRIANSFKQADKKLPGASMATHNAPQWRLGITTQSCAAQHLGCTTAITIVKAH